MQHVDALESAITRMDSVFGVLYSPPGFASSSDGAQSSDADAADSVPAEVSELLEQVWLTPDVTN